MNHFSRTKFLRIQFAGRGWILAGLFFVLAYTRSRSNAELQPFWLLLVVCALIWRFYAGRYIGKHSNGSQMGAHNLATAGPYQISRHPLYLANILSASGLILFANSLSFWAAGLFILAIVIHHIVLAKSEEFFLVQTLGTPYLDYLKSTPAWIGWPSWPNRSLFGAPIPGVWRRQGVNMAKSVLAVLILFLLASLSGKAH